MCIDRTIQYFIAAIEKKGVYESQALFWRRRWAVDEYSVISGTAIDTIAGGPVVGWGGDKRNSGIPEAFFYGGRLRSMHIHGSITIIYLGYNGAEFAGFRAGA